MLFDKLKEKVAENIENKFKPMYERILCDKCKQKMIEMRTHPREVEQKGLKLLCPQCKRKTIKELKKIIKK